MAWYWGGKTKGLYKYIMLQGDDEKLWSFPDDYKARHISGVQIWTANNWPFIDIYDYETTGKQGVGFSIVQKWNIHRKLKKLKQRIEKRERQEQMRVYARGYDSKEEMYLAKMVAGTLTGGKVK